MRDGHILRAQRPLPIPQQSQKHYASKSFGQLQAFFDCESSAAETSAQGEAKFAIERLPLQRSALHSGSRLCHAPVASQCEQIVCHRIKARMHDLVIHGEYEHAMEVVLERGL